MPAINFAQYVIPEETKKAPIQKLTLEQFSRKVHSKHNLLFALGVKGKFSRHFSWSSHTLCRLDIPAGASLLLYGVPPCSSQWTKALFQERLSAQGQCTKVQVAHIIEGSWSLHFKAWAFAVHPEFSNGRRGSRRPRLFVHDRQYYGPLVLPKPAAVHWRGQTWEVRERGGGHHRGQTWNHGTSGRIRLSAQVIQRQLEGTVHAQEKLKEAAQTLSSIRGRPKRRHHPLSSAYKARPSLDMTMSSREQRGFTCSVWYSDVAFWLSQLSIKHFWLH